ncbi:hypothetical protein [Synechococcus sp. CB0101]|uniref:hypothetical protein n=1 Tax=Synechococcus sp. CB0101 TaxID=232348 RepID=UPI001FED4B60|nr:hypothetical protein [Synechococcus sp. CB0101]
MEQERRRAVADPAYAPRLLGITNRPEELPGPTGGSDPRHRRRDRGGCGATKTFLGQLLAFYGLALAFAERRGGGATGHGPEAAPPAGGWPAGLTGANCEALVDDTTAAASRWRMLFADTAGM